MIQTKHYPNIKLYRIKQGLSQTELAEKLNLNPMSYSKKERGIREFTASELLKLAEVFNCSVDDLIKNQLI